MLKKTFLVILLTLSFSLFAYGGGFEISLNIPLGAAIGTPNDAMKSLGYQ